MAGNGDHLRADDDSRFVILLWRNGRCQECYLYHALDVFPTHGTGGIFGTVLTGIFIQEGLIAGTWDGFVIFLYHLLAIVIVFTYTFAMSWLNTRSISERKTRIYKPL